MLYRGAHIYSTDSQTKKQDVIPGCTETVRAKLMGTSSKTLYQGTHIYCRLGTKARRYIRVHISTAGWGQKRDVISGYTYLQQVGDKSKTLYQGTHICSRLGTKARRYIRVHISVAGWEQKQDVISGYTYLQQAGNKSKTLYLGTHIYSRLGTKASRYTRVH